MWENIPTLIRPYLNAVLIGIGGILVAFIASQVTSRLLSRPMGKGWSRFVSNLVALVIGIWTVKLILDSAGAAGLIIVLVTAITGAFALGSERFAGDLVSGISLFSIKSYEVGDTVQLAGQEGNVIDISLMTTTLQNVQGDRIYIRNSDVTATTITNYFSIVNDLGQSSSPISVKLALPVTQDLTTAISAIEKAIKDFAPNFKNSVYQPSVVAETAAGGYIILEVCAYVTERKDYGSEKTRLFLLAVNALKNAGLSLKP
jgi:small-conductance mechanosensitive channel